MPLGSEATFAIRATASMENPAGPLLKKSSCATEKIALSLLRSSGRPMRLLSAIYFIIELVYDSVQQYYIHWPLSLGLPGSGWLI